MKRTQLLIWGLLLFATLCRAQTTEPGWYYAGSQPAQAQPLETFQSKASGGQFMQAAVSEEPTAPIAEVITPQIQALADGLERDPERIFNYVHDNIRFVLYFGSKKGAQLTLLEKSGNDFDQSSLLVALLRAAGYTNVQYQFGWQELPYDNYYSYGYDLHHWWQLTLNNTNWTTTYTYLAVLAKSRGYPAMYYLSDGNTIVLQRTWVALTIDATTYNLDPAFKESDRTTGISLTNAMSTTAISNALMSAAAGTDTGNYTSGLNEPAVRNALTGYTTSLLNYIQTNSPNASVRQVLGGWRIYPASPWDFTTDPLFYVNDIGGTMPVLAWTYVPTNLMSTLTVAFASTNHQWLMPQLQGQRLALTYDNSGLAQLWQDDTNVASGNVGTASSANNVVLTVTHPFGTWDTGANSFVPNPTNFANACVTNSYQSTNATYALLYAFEPDWGWLQQRQKRLDAYLQAGLTNGSRQVVSETLNVMGLNWMLQSAETERLIGTQLGILPQYFHRLGRMGQESGQGYYVDVYLQLSGEYSSGGYDAAHLRAGQAHFDLSTYFASALEHGIIEQLQNTNLAAASTIKMLQLANTNGQAVYLASSTNWATVRSALVNYSSATTNWIYTNFINKGYAVLMPQNGSNHVSAATGSWAGYGLAARGTNFQMIISGGYHGGFVDNPFAVPNSDYTDYSGQNQFGYYTATPVSTPAPTGADPVDLGNGTFQVEHTDLTLGQGEPRGISFSRYYNGTRQFSSPAGMAGGWLHSYYFNAATVAAPQPGLGKTTPAQAAPMLAATAAAIAAYNVGVPNPKNWLVTSLIAKWGVDQLARNGVAVNMGRDTLQFVQQPDGSFTPPANCTWNLIRTNAAYNLLQRHGNTFKFDPLGRLTNIVDQYSQPLTLTYLNSTSSLPYTVKDWKNRTLTFNYTGTPQRLTSVSDGTRTVTYGYATNYNLQGDLVAVGDPEHKTNSYAYDSNHQITASFDALNRLVVSNVYDGQGHITTQYTQGDTNKTWRIYWADFETVTVDPMGGRTDYQYDSQSRLTWKYDPLNHFFDWSYDGQNHIVSTTSALWESTTYTYDGSHNLIRTIDPLGYTNRFIYDTNNNLVQTVDALGHTNRFGYNAKFQLTGSTNAAGEWYTLAYDSTTGNLLGHTDAGGTTSYGYDSYGQLNSITYPGGLGGEGFLNSTWGDVLSHTNARSFVTSFQYNSRRELTNTIAPTNVTARVAYDSVGNVLNTTDARGNVTSNTWSVTRKLQATTSPATPQGVPVVTNVYDSRDWLTRTLNPLQQPTTFTNDAVQRLLSITDPLLRTTTFGYDADNRKIATTNAALETMGQTWNARGELTLLTDNAGHTVGHRFDAAGNQVALTNRNTQRWQFQFDAANRLTNTISPLGRSNVVTFDNRGLVKTMREPSGQMTTNFFDARGRLTNLVDAVAGRSYRYDANNNLTNIVEDGKTNAWTFDAYDRVSTYKDANAYLIQYRYDANDNLTNLVYPGNRTVTYLYDSLNRMTNITDWAQRQTSLEYDLAGRLKKIIRPNNTVREINYDEAGQTTNLIEKLTSNFPIAYYRFNWDAASRAHWEFGAPLPHSNAPPVRLMTFDADNRLATFNLASVVNDPDGNLTYAPLTNSVMATYSYDARNRLYNAGGVTSTYDPAGNRVGVGTATLVVNPNTKLSQVLMRIRAGVTNYYVYGSGLLYEVDETATSTNTLTYHYDYRGSTVALTDGNGNVTDRIEYGAYGLTTYRSGTNDTPFLFNGRYGVQTDGNGLLCMRARFYNPYLCRFINADPSGFTGGLNFFSYADGNPISGIDATGFATYLIMYGEDTTTLFRDQATIMANRIERSSGFNPAQDNTVVVQTYNVSEMTAAFANNKDIASASYIGHGGKGTLYLGIPSGAGYNISVTGGPVNGVSDSTAMSVLPTQNIRPDAKINLCSCYSAVSDTGGTSIGQAFANQFNVPVQAAGAGVGFDEQGPYIRNWRAFYGILQNAFHQDGGGGWQNIQPEAQDQSWLGQAIKNGIK